jgi:UDP-N-acetyl-D-mannosaminuronic acid transferase (WecB/TagA/CpsF family)
VLNIWLDNLSKAELLDQLTSGIVFTPNVDHVMKLQRDQEFVKAYNTADFKVCDSQILIYAARFLGFKIKEKSLRL